eukprot:5617999-Amphidinium_carterae.2
MRTSVVWACTTSELGLKSWQPGQSVTCGGAQVREVGGVIGKGAPGQSKSIQCSLVHPSLLICTDVNAVALVHD